jgi:hypothetical protein
MDLFHLKKFRYSHILILFTFPLLLVLINNNWIFTPIDSMPMDPWFYFTNFLHFFAYAPVFPSNSHYFIERLTWNLPGYFIYHIFTPLIANYFLHLIVYYVAIFSLYGIVSILTNQRTGLVTALIMGSYPWFLRAVGWDYVDGAGIAQMLLVLFLLTKAAFSKKWEPYLFFAGAFFSSLLITNLFWLGLAPSAVIYYLLLKYQIHKIHSRQLIKAAIIFIAGALTIVLLGSLFYHSVTGEFNFLKNSITLSSVISNNLAGNRAEINAYWPRQPILLHMIPILLAIAGIVWLLKSKQHPQRNIFIVVIINFALSYAWILLWSLGGNPVELIPYYMSCLLPSTSMLLGVLLSTLVSDKEKLSNMEVIFSYIILSLPLLLVVLFPSLLKIQGNPWFSIICGLAIVVGLLIPQKKYMLYLIVFAFSFLSFLTGKYASIYISDRNQNQNNFLALVDSSNTIDNYYPHSHYGDFRIWAKGDSNFNTYLALQTIYLFPWGSSIILYPNADAFIWPDTTPMHDGAIILLGESPDALEIYNEAKVALAKYNVTLNLKNSDRIQQGNIGFTLVFTEITTTPTALQYGQKFTFDTPFSGSNFYPVEKSAQGNSFIWTGPGTESEIQFKLNPPSSDSEIKICSISALKPEVLTSFRLFVNNTVIPTKIEYLVDNCPSLIVGTIPMGVINLNPGETDLKFDVVKTVGPDQMGINPNDHRKLGLALNWIEIDNPIQP